MLCFREEGVDEYLAERIQGLSIAHEIEESERTVIVFCDNDESFGNITVQKNMCHKDIQSTVAANVIHNSVSAMFQRSTQFRYNQNIETFGENFYYNMRTCSHGSNCCKPECIKETYMRNMTTITGIYNEKCRQRWLWPWCKLCKLWICIPCFTSCVNSCIPVEPIAQNRDKHICHCHFQRVCKAHVARFRHFFPKYKFATCPTQFKCSRSNVPLQEWTGLMSEKRFEEQEYKEGRLHERFFM